MRSAIGVQPGAVEGSVVADPASDLGVYGPASPERSVPLRRLRCQSLSFLPIALFALALMVPPLAEIPQLCSSKFPWTQQRVPTSSLRPPDKPRPEIEPRVQRGPARVISPEPGRNRPNRNRR